MVAEQPLGQRRGVGGRAADPVPLPARAPRQRRPRPLARRQRLEIGVTAHKTTDLNVAIISADPGVNTSPGIAGGRPGHSGNYLTGTDAPLNEMLAQGTQPTRWEELAEAVPNTARISPKAMFPLTDTDVFVVEYSAGGGFGDPLNRDPELVGADVREHCVSAENAALTYGVVVDDEGTVDVDATTAARERLHAERLERATVPDGERNTVEVPAEGEGLRPWPGLVVAGSAADAVWACDGCGCDLGPATGNYKDAAAKLDRDPFDVDAVRYPRPSDFCDDEIVFREYFCPGCGNLFNTEVCKAADAPTWDLRLDDV